MNVIYNYQKESLTKSIEYILVRISICKFYYVITVLDEFCLTFPVFRDNSLCKR